MANTIMADEIREQFSQATPVMYQQEVPQYGTSLELVANVNLAVLENNPTLREKLANADELVRLNVECHSTIRVGTAQGLFTLRWVFAVMGMYPVGYYDLSQAGVSVHSTVLRPIDDASLSHNPFRVFTSLSRLKLIEGAALRQEAAEILAGRDIFTHRCHELLDEFDTQGSFITGQAQEFVYEVLETFRRHQHATVGEEIHHALYNGHRLTVDVACFPGCHVDHLTLRTLGVDRVQSMMPECGAEPKILVERPSRHRVPILLRQTNFRALGEPVLLTGKVRGTHTVRFGEVGQCDVALTPKGRALCDESPNKAGTGKDNPTHQLHLQEVSKAFPDSELLLRQQGLVWPRYRLTSSGEAYRQAIRPGGDPQPLIEQGWLVAQPITCEDFLPVSAAGIPQSNLNSETQARSHEDSSCDAFEQALGCTVYDEFALYQEAQERNERRCGLL